MRQIADRLNNPLEQYVPHLIEHQRQQNRGRKSEQQLQQADDNRIAHHRPEVRRVKERFEMLQPYPWTAEKSAEQLIILKRHQYPVHGQITEDENEDQRRHYH
ncbi:hypothetical protein D3C73_1165330 [compost metagenome]